MLQKDVQIYPNLSNKSHKLQGFDTSKPPHNAKQVDYSPMTQVDNLCLDPTQVFASLPHHPMFLRLEPNGVAPVSTDQGLLGG